MRFKIIAAGGKVSMPKFAIPKMAWQGYFIDTEGNTFGLHQADENAKRHTPKINPAKARGFSLKPFYLNFSLFEVAYQLKV